MDERDGNVEGAIAEARAAFVTALGDGDAAAVTRLYVDGARLLAPSAELFDGREAIARFWQAGVAAGVRAVELDVLELERHDGVAYEIGRYALRLRTDGGTVVDRGKYVLVHERQRDGAWLRAVETFNPDQPPARVDGRPEEGEIR